MRSLSARSSKRIVLELPTPDVPTAISDRFVFG
jgi:hypothetical protein